MNDKELALEIDNWFKNQSNNRNKWNQTNTGAIIKHNLTLLGNWKNKARGDATKGARMRKIKLLS